MRKALLATVIGLVATVLGAGPALACGGLIGRNGAVNLVKTTTLAAWHDGVEHYVTAFKFAGAGGEFGSIIPLPEVPTSVERGGDWTLQRLVREVTPQPEFARSASASNSGATLAADAQVLLETRIDALDITVLKGGGQAVGEWAAKNGFLLTPDTPEVLDFYANRSPIFLAARFNGEAAQAKGLAVGDGTPVHITIPTPQPWVPLRILGVGLKAAERINADVFLLTDKQPALLPGLVPGLALDRSGPATSRLLTDLRTDKGMEWVPQSMWLSYLKVNALPSQLTFDLAVDASGAGQPSAIAAGYATPSLAPPAVVATDDGSTSMVPWVVAGVAVLALAASGVLVAARRR